MAEAGAAPIAARAAGKLMLAGEYAVLFEPGRCVSLAVGDIAWATWRPRADPSAPAQLTLDAFDTVRSWPMNAIPNDGLMGFIRGALAEVATMDATASAKDQGESSAGQDLHVRVTGQLQGRKFGLGSSAATTIAVLRAGLLKRGLPANPARLVPLANAVHRHQQGGQGSGYDVVSIAHGGCVAYERSTRAVEQLPWVQGLYGAALYTGVPSSTIAALRRGIGPSTAGIGAIAAATDELLTAWRRGIPGGTLAALAACEAAFDVLAADHPWMTPAALQALRKHIQAHGGVARTSGAGGGDCVWAWTDDPARLDALIAAWPEPCVARLPEALGPVEGS